VAVKREVHINSMVHATALYPRQGTTLSLIQPGERGQNYQVSYGSLHCNSLRIDRLRMTSFRDAAAAGRQ
jgi:hypothetical protein